ncbi:MAG: class I SAM-dependent methyltransferase [Candidatus Hodarchaeales archaeon]|jgi:SAM-dependent methyltransferase
MKNGLLSGGDMYDSLVNWSKRLSIEIPFLTSIIGNRLSIESKLLSVGCGTGQHLFELRNHYDCSITGLDIDESMIEKAKQTSSDVKFIVADFLDVDILSKNKYDVIFSLGNSIGLIASASASYDRVIKKLKSYLTSNGILIFQILNTMNERNGWSAPRRVITELGEYVFLRGFSTTKKFIHPEILTLFRGKDEDEFQLKTTGKANIPRITVEEMTLLLQQADFSNIRVFGDYFKKPFNAQTSTDMIFIAES